MSSHSLFAINRLRLRQCLVAKLSTRGLLLVLIIVLLIMILSAVFGK